MTCISDVVLNMYFQPIVVKHNANLCGTTHLRHAPICIRSSALHEAMKTFEEAGLGYPVMFRVNVVRL